MAAGISTQTRKRLWLRSGGRCAFPGCSQHLVEAVDPASDTVLGIECHIVAQNDDPQRVARSPSALSEEERAQWAHLLGERHGFANIVLMCPTHSALIDDPRGGYSVGDVVAMKRAHEQAEDMRRAGPLSPDEEAQLRYAEIVDEWERRVDLDNWDSWMGGVFGDGHPHMRVEYFERLRESREWLFSRIWPGTLPEVEQAFENFRRIVQDLQLVFEQYPHEVLARQGLVAPTRFYNDPEWIRRFHEDFRLLDQMYEWYSNLLEDLALELARAANLVCTAVRRFLDPRYRLSEGHVVIQSGPYEDLMYRKHRPLYRPDQGWLPYTGVRPFLADRQDRDEHRGDGPPPTGIRLPGDSYFNA